MRTLLSISARMKQARPVFIVGEARSGTSILYRTLQKHPSFRPRQQNLVETEIFDQLRRVFLFGRQPPDSLVRFMLDDRAVYDDFVRSILPARIMSAVAAAPNYLLRERADPLWSLTLNHLVVRSYFFHAARARGCTRLVEKTPNNTRHLERIKAAFPQARMLYVHRHPVDVFSSYRRRAADDVHAGWAAVDVDDFCGRYETGAERAMGWRARGGDDLLLVRYEDFTGDPAPTFGVICRFLDEPVDLAAVEEHQPDVGRWRGDPLLWGPIVAETKRWSDHMTEAEAVEIEHRLARVMARLGHEPYVDA